MPEHEATRFKRKFSPIDESGIMSSGSAILTVGFIITLVSVLADIIGYGTFDEFGVLQILGTVAGGALIILGIIIKVGKKIWYG